MHFHIVTLFPEVFKSYLNTSILGRAIKDKKIKVSFYNPIDFEKKGVRVDDRPFGGGPGMVLRVEPFLKAFQKAVGRKKDVLTYIFSPSGKEFDSNKSRKLSKEKNVVLICGHYEGIDERLKKITKAKPISIGNYTLTGGEIPALVVIDSVSRYIKGVLGNVNSIEEDRISSPEVYTRPRKLEYKGRNFNVPSVLLNGNHKDIEEWKNSKRIGKT